jgi:hypothetical protein
MYFTNNCIYLDAGSPFYIQIKSFHILFQLVFVITKEMEGLQSIYCAVDTAARSEDGGPISW